MTYLANALLIGWEGRASLKGCEIVAGGPQTTGNGAPGPRHPEGVLESPHERAVAPLQGANLLVRLPEVCATLRPPATIFQPFGLIHLLFKYSALTSQVCHSSQRERE
jgi:hypothetical protein